MTSGYWALIGVVLNNVVWFVLCVGAWHLSGKDHWEAGREYERERGYWKQIRENRAAARAQARELHPSAGWYQPVPPRPQRRRVVMTSGQRAPVTVVPVGPAVIPLRPQPSRISGAGTVPLSALTTTGEMRAATTEFIAERIVARSERDRQEITS